MSCECESDLEHRLLVERVNESFTRDPMRARMRVERSSSRLRWEVLRREDMLLFVQAIPAVGQARRGPALR